MTDPTLFDPARTTTTQCSHCGATRQPHQPTAPLCHTDIEWKTGNWERRPPNCLNKVDPQHQEIPY